MINQKFVLAHLDDDPLELKRFSRLFTNSIEFSISSFSHSTSFLKFASETKKIDFCILDIVLSADEKTDGLSLIQYIKKMHPECVVIVSSFNDETSFILKALSLQADDFFSKKIWPENIEKRLSEVHHYYQIKNGRSNINGLYSASTIPSVQSDSYAECAGKTLKTIENRAKLILKSAVRCVLIEGESGTGKEVVADIFEHYTKAQGPFVRLNCASLAQNLLESELFGYKKGAFTGALQDKIGFIEAAHNGFLFLDEVSSLSLAAQAALLRTIENQEVIRLGETYPRKVNVRFLCASNLSLQELVNKNTFRKDLWQRLREIDISLPPLHQRKDEIPDLVDFFCSKFKERQYAIDPLAKRVLCAFDWRDGNIRELRNTLRAMTEFAQNGILSVGSIPNRVIAESLNGELTLNEPQDVPKISLNLSKDERQLTYSELCDELLNQIIQKNIQKKGKLNITQLAKELNVSRSTLHSKIKEPRL